MPILEIMGRRVEVGDEFTGLSPEAQQSTVNEIASQFSQPAPQANAPVAVTPGEKQAKSDKELLEQSGWSPTAQAIQAPLISGANALGLYAPRAAIAAGRYLAGNAPTYSEAFEKQKQYEEALERQNPYLSGAGTAAGIGAGFLLPTGWFGAGARLAGEAAGAAKLGTAATRAAEIGGAGAEAAGLSGVSSALETMDPREALKGAATGAVLGGTLHGALGSLLPGKVKPASDTELQGALDRAVGPGKIGVNDIPGYRELAAERGATPDVARQAILQSQNVETPTLSMVSGRAAPAAAKEVSEQAAQKAKDTLAAQAEKMAGTAPAEEAIGEALHRKITEAKPAVRAEYEQLSQLGKGAMFDESVPGNFIKTITPMLADKQIPFESEELARAGYDKASKAMKYVEEGIASDNLPLKDLVTGVAPRDVSNYEAVRKVLRGFRNDATGEDRTAASVILDGFDKVYNNALKTALTKEGDPDIGKKITDQLTKAREASKDFHQRFTAKYGTSSPEFMRVVNQMVDQSTGQIVNNIPVGSASAAQKILTGSIMKPQLGEAMYVRLENALGKNTPEMTAVTQQIQNHVLTPEVGKDLSSLPDRIDKFIAYNPKVAQRVFSGVGEQPSIQNLRKLSESIRIVNNSKAPAEEKVSRIGSLVGWLTKGTLVTLGAGHGVIPSALTYAATEGAQAGASALRSGAARRSELAGAPVTRQAPEIPSLLRTPAAYRLPEAALIGRPGQEEGYQDPRPLGTPRMGRKAGGRVSDRLIREVERSKKSINSDTESLLNTPDSHVAHALAIANRNLEG